MSKPEFTSERVGTGEIVWTSTRLGVPVAVEENKPDGGEGARQFRIYPEGIELPDDEFDRLMIGAGWDLDGSHQAALDARTAPATEEQPMIPSEAVLHAPGMVQGPPPEEKSRRSRKS